MSSPILIGPEHSTPGLVSSARSKKREVPNDLLIEASQRLALMAMTAFVLWIVADVLWHATWPSFHPGEKPLGFHAPDVLTVVAAMASVALWVFIKRTNRSPHFYLNLGLGYLVVTCFAIAVVMRRVRARG